MSDAVRFLIIDDDPSDVELMLRELKREGLRPDWVRVQTEAEFLEQLDRAPEVILADSGLASFDSIAALDLLNRRGLDIPFLVVSGQTGENLAVEAMKRGACDYLLKDQLGRLGESVRRALEQKRVQRELRQSEERYRLVSEASSDYFYSLKVRPEGEWFLEWITEPAFTRITGFDAHEINRLGVSSILLADDAAIIAQHQQALLAGRADSIDVRIETKDGCLKWLRVHETPVFAPDNPARVERIYGAAKDITERKELEERLLQSRKLEAIGQLAGGVAHDFNNLLTVICGYGDLLMKLPELGETGREYAGEILAASQRAARLTRQLMAFGSRQVQQIRTIDLNNIVRNLEKMLRRVIGEDVELRISYGADPAFINADAGQIEQVIMNLVVNARDAMPKGGRLAIETANANESELVLSVSDTGAGMHAATVSRIFEPFFTTKESGKGTGLGLSMVYGIIRQSGGEVSVVSAPGEGTTFRISLPRAEQVEADAVDAAPFTLRPAERTEKVSPAGDDESRMTAGGGKSAADSA